MSLNRISLVSVPLSDQAAAREFFVEFPGFDVRRDDATGPGCCRVRFVPPGGNAFIARITGLERMPVGCSKGLVLPVSGVDDAYETLKGRGAGVSDVQSAPRGRYSTFADPDANGWVDQEAAASGN